MNTATAITIITTVTISDTTIEGFDVCAACPRSLIVDFALTMLEPIEGGHTMVTFPKSEIAERLNAIPRGTMLRVTFRGASPKRADEVLVALDAAGFKHVATARYEDTQIGKPGKEKTIRDGMLAFSAPATLEDEIAAFGKNLVGLLRNPLLG